MCNKFNGSLIEGEFFFSTVLLLMAELHISDDKSAWLNKLLGHESVIISREHGNFIVYSFLGSEKPRAKLYHVHHGVFMCISITAKNSIFSL